jgi:SAM-dependent methyltransferase
MSNESIYDKAFFLAIMDGSYKSAKLIVPIVSELISPRSVCDVGCGVGTWLRVWSELGVPDLYGIDGDYVDTKLLVISPKQFHGRDLRKPFSVERRFDLAMSLEVAEHLPSARAASFIADLTALAPVVLFSAAVPSQGGTDHVNEQWQSYWADLFRERGFTPVDVIRPMIWENVRVMRWYRQNVLLYCCEEFLHLYPKLSGLSSNFPLSVVHPEQYIIGLADKLANQGSRESFTALRSAVRRSVSRALLQKLR